MITRSTLDLRDDLDRFLVQSKALVAVVAHSEDNPDSVLDRDILGQVLWLLGDRLDDVQATYKELEIQVFYQDQDKKTA